MKLYYKVYHFYFRKIKDRFNFKDIGIYDSLEKANNAIETLKTQEGFIDYPDNFYVIKTIRFHSPKLLNRTFWEEGFTVVKS